MWKKIWSQCRSLRSRETGKKEAKVIRNYLSMDKSCIKQEKMDFANGIERKPQGVDFHEGESRGKGHAIFINLCYKEGGGDVMGGRDVWERSMMSSWQ